MLRTTPDTQPESVLKKRIERNLLKKVSRRRIMLSLQGGPLMGVNDLQAFMKRRMISETEDMLVVKKRRTGAKIGGSVVARWR